MILFYLWVIVQIVTESLPISSSGHQLLFERLFSFSPQDYFFSLCAKLGNVVNSSAGVYISNSPIDFVVVEHALHVPTVLILMVFFAPDWFFLLSNLMRCKKIIMKLVLLTALANMMTLFLFIWFKATHWSLPLSVNFLITGALLTSLSWCVPGSRGKGFDLSSALILGGVQGLALMPGISRFALVLVVARWLGFTPHKAFKITFMLQWPLIAAASGLGVYKLYGAGVLGGCLSWQILVVVFLATVSAYGVLCVVERMYMRGMLWIFGWYMGLPALLALIH